MKVCIFDCCDCGWRCWRGGGGGVGGRRRQQQQGVEQGQGQQGQGQGQQGQGQQGQGQGQQGRQGQGQGHKEGWQGQQGQCQRQQQGEGGGEVGRQHQQGGGGLRGSGGGQWRRHWQVFLRKMNWISFEKFHISEFAPMEMCNANVQCDWGSRLRFFKCCHNVIFTQPTSQWSYIMFVGSDTSFGTFPKLHSKAQGSRLNSKIRQRFDLRAYYARRCLRAYYARRCLRAYYARRYPFIWEKENREKGYLWNLIRINNITNFIKTSYSVRLDKGA